jgi:ABC-type transport system involved in cytochrome c biogenesis permease subunit
MVESIIAWSATLSFMVAAIVLFYALRKGGAAEFKIGGVLMALGGLDAVSYMLVVTYRLGAFPIINPWIGASFLSFLLAAFAVIAWLLYREPAFLTGASPVAAMFSLVASLRPVTSSDFMYLADRLSAMRPEVPNLGTTVLTSTWFPAHVTLAFTAYALFALSATMGLLQLRLLKALKSKSGGRPLQFLPPLPVVEHAGIVTAFAGIATLTIGMIIGAVGAHSFFKTTWLGDPKELAGMAVLVMYAILESARMAQSWPGRRTAMAHVVGFAALLVIFLGSSFLGPRTHGF